MSTTTGSSFGDVVPYTELEKKISLFVMLIGAGFYMKIFSDFVTIINLRNSH